MTKNGKETNSAARLFISLPDNRLRFPGRFDVVCSHEEGLVAGDEFTNERSKLVKLFYVRPLV